MKGKPIDAHQVGTVHDSLVFYCRKEHLDRFCRLLVKVCSDVETPAEVFDFEFTVPLAVDVKYGTNWADMEEWKEGGDE